ncbi:flagellar biosynthetic protein FliO [Escherichia coli]|nr:flagellar biosynthetic protein FliO [Escherichia coli]HAG7217342.1 flagellar biosynthetic protein FliO [Escherichia coli]HAL7243496.1 flagellar biosynthetic protein FliO [Escherichia coli]HAN2232057.1 flagellar biosynthetic protein FliO [Escherichia coli]HAW8025611.1 flagellar biosynthetic protein FliO [Escherichia coli]
MMNNHATVQSSTPVSAAPLLQVSGALIAIIALILAAAWLVKRLGFAPKRTGVNGLKISASASLGARERVVVVDVEDARLVLGVTAGKSICCINFPLQHQQKRYRRPIFSRS